MGVPTSHQCVGSGQRKIAEMYSCSTGFLLSRQIDEGEAHSEGIRSMGDGQLVHLGRQKPGLLRAKAAPTSWHTPRCHDSITRLPAHVEASRKNRVTQPEWNSLSNVVLSLNDVSGHEQLYISLGFTDFLIKFYLHCQKKLLFSQNQCYHYHYKSAFH